jgi:hypothetical protein
MTAAEIDRLAAAIVKMHTRRAWVAESREKARFQRAGKLRRKAKDGKP